MNDRATFTRMDQSTAADWALIVPEAMKLARTLPDRVLEHLMLLKGDDGGFPIDRLDHCLLTATLALKDGRDDEYVTCALLHDVGDTLGSYNHPDVAAAILKPFISEANHWMIVHHGIFQGYNFFHHVGLDRNMRDHFTAHEHAARTQEFIDRYDNLAFDPRAEIYPLETFAPIVRRVMAVPKNSIYKAAMARQTTA